MAKLKPCPILVASPRDEGTLCIQQHCAWWCEYAKCCSVPLIAGILADSTISQSVFREEKDNMRLIKCESCLNSRFIVSENGSHYVCCLSGRAAVQCMTGQRDGYIKKPMRKDGADNV